MKLLFSLFDLMYTLQTSKIWSRIALKVCRQFYNVPQRYVENNGCEYFERAWDNKNQKKKQILL